MLFILFQLGANRYAIEARRVAEVLPLMRIEPLPHAPACVAGVLSYRGAPMPVIDFSQLTLGRPAAERLSTRILVINCADGRQIGLIAERAHETLRREPADFSDTGIVAESAPYLGPVTRDACGFVQWIDLDKLMGGAMLKSLAEAA